MFRESNSYGSAVMRHPDGSINFDAYRAVARRERQAAIASSIEGAARAANALLLSLGAHLARRIAKHPAHHAK
jgi:hypothetical protein